MPLRLRTSGGGGGGGAVTTQHGRVARAPPTGRRAPKLPRAQLPKVLRSLGHHVSKELHLDAPRGHAADGHVCAAATDGSEVGRRRAGGDARAAVFARPDLTRSLPTAPPPHHSHGLLPKNTTGLLGLEGRRCHCSPSPAIAPLPRPCQAAAGLQGMVHNHTSALLLQLSINARRDHQTQGRDKKTAACSTLPTCIPPADPTSPAAPPAAAWGRGATSQRLGGGGRGASHVLAAPAGHGPQPGI